MVLQLFGTYFLLKLERWNFLLWAMGYELWAIRIAHFSLLITHGKIYIVHYLYEYRIFKRYFVKRKSHYCDI
jgi:hypothetical protein